MLKLKDASQARSEISPDPSDRGDTITPMSGDRTGSERASTEASPDSLELTGRLVMRNIRIAAQHIDRALEELDRDNVGLSPSGIKLLINLRELSPHQSSPSQLGRRLSLTSGSMTSLIDRLEEAGYVFRQPDPYDRRGVLVSLTPLGLETANDLYERYSSLERRVLTPLSDGEREQLTDLLVRLNRFYEDGGLRG